MDVQMLSNKIVCVIIMYLANFDYILNLYQYKYKK